MLGIGDKLENLLEILLTLLEFVSFVSFCLMGEEINLKKIKKIGYYTTKMII